MRMKTIGCGLAIAACVVATGCGKSRVRVLKDENATLVQQNEALRFELSQAAERNKSKELELDEARADVASLRAQMDNARREMSASMGRYEQARRQLNQAESTVASLKASHERELTAARADAAKAQAELEMMNRQVDELSTQLVEAEAALKAAEKRAMARGGG